MGPDELEARTRAFSLRVLKLVNALPQTIVGWELGKQLLRSGMSVSANYRAARRARSRNEFIAKISIVNEEIDETAHWLSMVIDGEVLPRERVEALAQEADELMRLFAATRRTALKNNRQIARSPDRQIQKDQ